MKILPALLLLLYSITAFSQTDTLPTKKNKKVWLNFFVSPEINSLHTANPFGHETTKAGLGFSTGTFTLFKLTKNIRFRTGLAYGFKTYKHEQTDLIFQTDINPQSGVISHSRIESTMRYSEFQIPLAFQFYFLNRTFYLSTGADLILPFADVSKRTIYYGNGTTENLNPPRAHIFVAPTFSIGYFYALGPNLSIRFEPYCRFYLDEYRIIDSRLHNFGLRLIFRGF